MSNQGDKLIEELEKIRKTVDGNDYNMYREIGKCVECQDGQKYLLRANNDYFYTWGMAIKASSLGSSITIRLCDAHAAVMFYVSDRWFIEIEKDEGL
jgi:hypothetical protein